MNSPAIYSTIILIIILSSPSGSLAAGGLVRLLELKDVADSQASAEKDVEQEQKNYDRAASFINGPEIRQGIGKDFIVSKCGEPVVKIKDGAEWVYKPSDTSFFKGEKIYLVFDKDGLLQSWEKVEQK